MRYPENSNEQFEWLVNQAERYIRARRVSDRSLTTWRNRAVDWLKQNSPKTYLSRELLVVPVHHIQRGLRVLLKAQPVVPFVRKGSGPPNPSNTKRVFIVHGHDDRLKNGVARFLARVGLTPVILHEQPSRGRTIIEKFIEYSDVGFAVVMELGFFLGHLGRERVAAIYDERVEMPSDYRGVVFLPYDPAGMWQHLLVKEIKAAGMMDQ